MSATQPQRPEAGLRNHRTEFARESAFGATGSDPSFLKYSSSVTNVTWSSGATLEARRSLGNADPVDHHRGPESHELTVTYDLCKFFTDAGSANDAAYDGLARDADNLLPNSHTLVDREDKGQVAAANTVSGNTARPTRIFTVGKGGLIDEVAVTGDPSDSQPISVELSYVFQKVRSYQIDQPNSGTLLAVRSTDAGDTSQSVTIEDEGGATAETLALNGTSLVSTSNTYADIDAVELSAETAGDVEVVVNTGSATSPTAGDVLASVAGATTYDNVEGDLGVPALGAGSHEDAGTLPAPEQFIGDRILRAASPVPHEIPSATLTVSNNVEEQEVSSGFGMSLHPANRNITLEASMFGENQTHAMLVDHLQNNSKSIDWEMTGGTVTLESAALTEPGDRAAEEGQAVMTSDNTFEATGIAFA